MSITTSLNWPETLPLPLSDGYAASPVSPVIRTELDSGRAIMRRRYVSTPVRLTVSWLLDDEQAATFESFFYSTLSDGVKWFNIALRLPGKADEDTVVARFTDIPDGPVLTGGVLWEYSATLEMWERYVVTKDREDP
ncbi:hypothetical protein [Escherichia coli]|uniref:hypothetical protein n=1 Tax=Escherichia coli TaxID=562 RepID=UPI001F0E7CB9|nr:hypothetical protein [Escherichia coli]UMR98483.1 hypothetical protein AOY87_09475 [Escherichia coli]UMR98832.1 hypothetical protein AOY87_11515 [Escherichia coli]